MDLPPAKGHLPTSPRRREFAGGSDSSLLMISLSCPSLDLRVMSIERHQSSACSLTLPRRPTGYHCLYHGCDTAQLMPSKGSILLLGLGKVVIQEKAARIPGCDSHNRYGWRRRLISQMMEQWMVKSREDRLFETSTVVQEVRTSPMHQSFLGGMELIPNLPLSLKLC